MLIAYIRRPHRTRVRVVILRRFDPPHRPLNRLKDVHHPILVEIRHRPSHQPGVNPEVRGQISNELILLVVVDGFASHEIKLRAKHIPPGGQELRPNQIITSEERIQPVEGFPIIIHTIQIRITIARIGR